MSGRTYWSSVIAVLGATFAVWFAVGSWLNVTDPAPGAAVMAVVSMTGYVVLLGWLLKSPAQTAPRQLIRSRQGTRNENNNAA